MADLALSAEQEQICSSLAGLLREASSIDTVRAAEPLGFEEKLWRRVHELGVLDMVAPDAIEEPVLTSALLCEQAGEVLAPVPLVETLTAVRLLDSLGTDAAYHLADLIRTDGGPATVSLRHAHDGTAAFVPAGAVARIVVALEGSSLRALVDEPPGVALPNLGALPIAHRRLDGASTLALGDDARAAHARAIDEWRVLTAALLVGAAWRALRIAIDYTTSRKAFGVPIATYQTVNHRLADLATGLTGARLLARRAAWELDRQGPRGSTLASMAFSFCTEQAEATTAEALHFHGGYGFMMEYDIQLYLRRVKAWATQLGDASRELRRVADGLWPTAELER